MNQNYEKLYIGLDVGSTTVKAVVVDPVKDEILWQDYQRHDTKQPEKCLEFLKRIEDQFPLPHENIRIFVTGSGGGGIARLVGAKFVQEVNAVSLAVEKLYPEAGSVIELGGQDAKIIIFKEDPETGKKKKIPSMNDKYAGGTGAVIDKINAKLKIPTAQLLQNLSVLTRGHTLKPHVLLLGGPNSFIRGMREAWQANIPRMWQERKVKIPDGAKPEDLIEVPENDQYFEALGTVEFGRNEE